MKNHLSLYILSAVIAALLIIPIVFSVLWSKKHDNADNIATHESSTADSTDSSPGSLNSSFTILIDPGHGGYDPGKVSPDGIEEKDINLAISLKLYSLLSDMGYHVYLTRDNDSSLNASGAGNKKASDLTARTQLAKTVGADLYLSIHQNSYSAEYVHGAQVFYYSTSGSGKALAENIQRHLISDADPDNHRDAKGNSGYMVLKESPCTAVIVECGFLSNADECSRLCDYSYQQALAAAIANAVDEWAAAP